MTRNIVLAVIVLAAACGKKDDKGGGGGGGGGGGPTIDVAAVNALVPAALKDKLVFEKRDVVEERGKHSTTTYTLAGPKGWTQDMKMFAKLKPPSGGAFDAGFMTSFDVGSNCDGDCVAKDWAATSEKVNFKQFRDKKIEKDELGKTDHMMIASDGDSRFVMYAWWTADAKHYFTCMAHLEKPVADAAPAFEKACRAVAVSGDD
jgi:hypothetical protein